MITEEEIKELRELEERASEGPWENELDLDPPDSGIEAVSGGTICHIQHHGNYNIGLRTGEWFSYSDARFIVTARNKFVMLLDEIERLQKEYKRLNDLVHTYANKDTSCQCCTKWGCSCLQPG
jgi:hypothetical protein